MATNSDQIGQELLDGRLSDHDQRLAGSPSHIGIQACPTKQHASQGLHRFRIA
jgi:hypothetical protein